MNRYYGKVGYSVPTETSPGVWEDVISEIDYYGDVIRSTSRVENGTGINDDITVSNTISILADPFAFQNFSFMKYLEWMDCLWKITNVEVQYPRLLLTIGGVYNGKQT